MHWPFMLQAMRIDSRVIDCSTACICHCCHNSSAECLPLYKITLSEAFKLHWQSPFTLMSAVSQAESGPEKLAANR
jgi:hypothetical protein